MAFTINNVPLTSESVVEIDFTGLHNFATKTSYTCQLDGVATISTAPIQSTFIECRTGAKRTIPKATTGASDTMDITLWYADAIATTDEEFDEAWDAKGDTIAVRVYPAGTSTNSRYFQAIGTLNNVTVPTVTMDENDFKFTLSVEGPITKAKVTA